MKPGADFASRVRDLEEAYEYFLAYAAQGRRDEDRQLPVRQFLAQAEAALEGLPDSAETLLQEGTLVADDTHRQFVALLAQDIAKALVAVRLVLAQANVGSQLIDNLNASIHLRTVLTDLFLLDEVRTAGKRQTRDDGVPAQ